MRSKIVRTIFKKEIIDIIRDKKTLFMGIVLPLILYPLLMIIMTQIMTISMNSIENDDINIAFEKYPSKELITLIKNYRKDIKDDEVIGLLESVKNILIYTDEVTDKEVPAKEYGYFMGNLICTEEFRNKYSKKFENAMTNKVDSKHIMIDYLNDYIDECISAKFHGEEINKDYPLRNLEKYFSDYVESVTKIDNTEIMRHMESLLDRVEKEK